MPLAVFRTKALRALPGPISMTVSKPWASSHRMESSKYTLLWTCRSSRAGMVSSSVLARPRQLNTTGKAISPKASLAKRVRRASPALFMRLVWKGPLTFRGTHRRAPCSVALAQAASTAPPSPAMTIWPGQL